MIAGFNKNNIGEDMHVFQLYQFLKISIGKKGSEVE